MSDHTPGPWVQFAYQGRVVALMPAMREGDICEFSKSPSDADARLMAAAPVMLVELKQCATKLEEAANLLSRGLPGMASIYRIAAKRVRRSIEQAEDLAQTSAERTGE